jgi:hypothetical protein
MSKIALKAMKGLFEEVRQQVLEAAPACIYLRAGERGASREGLERLNKAAFIRIFEEPIDCPLPNFSLQGR